MESSSYFFLYGRIPKKLTPPEILQLYKDWCEQHFAAGFIDPSEDIVEDFRKWLHQKTVSKEDLILEDYEIRMLVTFINKEFECKECEAKINEV